MGLCTRGFHWESLTYPKPFNERMISWQWHLAQSLIDW
jgi:hypothetical protein